MKKNRIIAIFLVIVVMSTMLIACSKSKEYNEEEVTVTELVTDENGETVTDANGEAETVVVEVPNDKGNGTGSGGGNSSTNDKKETTTSPLATTEAPAPIPPEDETTKKNDIEMTVTMPFFSSSDQNNYQLVVKIGKKELVYDVVGCKGQNITVVIPKGYNGDKATFSLDMKGKNFSADAKIQNGTRVVLQTIVIVDGDDD